MFDWSVKIVVDGKSVFVHVAVVETCDLSIVGTWILELRIAVSFEDESSPAYPLAMFLFVTFSTFDRLEPPPDVGS